MHRAFRSHPPRWALLAFATCWGLFVAASALRTWYPIVLADETAYLLPTLLGYRAENYARWAIIPQHPNVLYFALCSLLPASDIYDSAKWMNAVLIAATAAPAYGAARRFLPEYPAALFAMLVIAGPTSSFARYFMPENAFHFGFWCVVFVAMASPSGQRGFAGACVAGALAGVLALVKPHAFALAIALTAYFGLRKGPAPWRIAASGGVVVCFLAARFVVFGLLMRSGDSGLAGTSYGELLRHAVPQVDALAASLAGHAAALAVLAAVPLWVAGRAIVAGSADDADLRDLSLLAVCILAALLAMTIYFSAAAYAVSPATERITRLHGRYYAFALPLVLLAYATHLHGQPAVSDRLLRGSRPAMTAMAVGAAVIVLAFEVGIVDYAELALLTATVPARAGFAATLGLTYGIYRVLRRRMECPTALAMMPLVWWAALMLCTSTAALAAPVTGRILKPSAVDIAFLAEPAARALVGRDDGLVVGSRAAPLDAYRAMFHLRSLAAGALVDGGRADPVPIPAGARWMLLMPGVSFAGAGARETIGPLVLVRLDAPSSTK